MTESIHYKLTLVRIYEDAIPFTLEFTGTELRQLLERTQAHCARYGWIDEEKTVRHKPDPPL